MTRRRDYLLLIETSPSVFDLVKTISDCRNQPDAKRKAVKWMEAQPPESAFVQRYGALLTQGTRFAVPAASRFSLFKLRLRHILEGE